MKLLDIFALAHVVVGNKHIAGIRSLLGNVWDVTVQIEGRDDLLVIEAHQGMQVSQVLDIAMGNYGDVYDAWLQGQLLPRNALLADAGVGSETTIRLVFTTDELRVLWNSLVNDELRVTFLGFRDLQRFQDHYSSHIGRPEQRPLFIQNGHVLKVDWSHDGVERRQLQTSDVNWQLFKTLPSLQRLNLMSNDLSGTFRASWLPVSLKAVFIGWNQISSFVFDAELPHLKNFSAVGNKLSSFDFSRVERDMPQLQSLTLFNNQISQELDLRALPSVSKMCLSNNHFHGIVDFSNMQPRNWTLLLLRNNPELRWNGQAPINAHMDASTHITAD